MNAKLIARELSVSHKNRPNWKTSALYPNFHPFPFYFNFKRFFLNALITLDFYDTNLLFSPPRSSTPQTKTIAVSILISADLAQSSSPRLLALGSLERLWKGTLISCDPDVLKGVNLSYGGLLRTKLFEYNFY